jgi:hypothetical protein
MAEMPKAKGGEQYHGEPTGLFENPVVPTLAQAGIDKNLANCAMTSKRVEMPTGGGTCLKLDYSLWELVRSSSWWR